VILRGLVVQAALRVCNIATLKDFNGESLNIHDYSQFSNLTTLIVDLYLLPSTSRLEMLEKKTLKDSSQSGHAVLLVHDLMTLREMQHAIKHGHPQHIL